MPFRKADMIQLKLIIKQYESLGEVDKLIEQLADEQWQMRRAAARSLGSVGSRSALPALEKLAEDPKREVKVAAGEVVVKLGR